MASITLSVPEELKKRMDKFSEVNWSEYVTSCIEKKIKRLSLGQEILARLHSKEEQEFIKWSVELGRKAKKGSFEKLLSQLSPEKRNELENLAFLKEFKSQSELTKEDASRLGKKVNEGLSERYKKKSELDLLDSVASKSKLSEKDALEIGRKIKKSMWEQYKVQS